MKGLGKIVPILAAAAASYVIGLNWGLPSPVRSEKVLLPSQRNEAFYRRLEDNRHAMYQRLGLDLQAYLGREVENGTVPGPVQSFQPVRYPAGEKPSPELMHGFSSFMLRSVEQDEQFVLNTLSRLKPQRLQFNPHESLYGGAYLYPLGAFFVALRAVGFLHLTPDGLYYYREPGQLARLYEAGRLFSGFAGLACAALIFLLARRLYGDRVAMWSTALFAFAPAVNAFSHVMKPHLPGTLLSLACLYFCAEASASKRTRDLLLSGLFFGLAVGCVKYLAVLALPLWVSFFAARGRLTARTGLEFLALNALSVAVFFIVNPYVLVNWADFTAANRGMAYFYHSDASPAAVFDLIVFPLRRGLGTGTWLLSLAGVAAAAPCAWRRPGSDRLILLFLLPMLAATAYLFASAARDVAIIRFCLPSMALVAILGARWAAEMASPRIGGALLLFCVLCNAAVAGLYDANFVAGAGENSNAAEAGRLIEQDFPPGTALGMSTPAPMTNDFPPLAFSRYELVYLSFQSPVPSAAQAALPGVYLTNAQRLGSFSPDMRAHYAVERVFDSFSWHGHAFRDIFTDANFPVALLRKRS